MGLFQSQIVDGRVGLSEHGYGGLLNGAEKVPDSVVVQPFVYFPGAYKVADDTDKITAFSDFLYGL